MEGKRGGLLKVAGEGEAREYWYAGTETYEAWVGRGSSAETRHTPVEGVSGQEGYPPLEGHRTARG